ncbi:MAG: DUF1385 domain-containing protein, partial [Thermoanaerobaculia bacterium]|nr:DUF1385 domain-containing protein [Thermoanaerobaculia bacterium]
MNRLVRFWRQQARLFAAAFGAVTNGLTSAMPTEKPDNNVDMIVGGQAVIEGVMMRGYGGYSVAVRQPDGGIAIRQDRIEPLAKKYPFLKTPILRGSIVLIQSLVLGIRALNFSAIASSEDEDGEPELSNWAIFTSMAMAFLLGIGLFILAPLALTNLIRSTLMPAMDNVTYNMIDGVIRAVFFFIYVWSISFMPDIRRVFQYHGAEHKTVYTFEAHEDLTVENAQKKSTLHPRCGTSFLLFVMAVSIVVFSAIPQTAPFSIKFGARVVLLPLIAGIAYEMIRFSARHLENRVCRAMIAPGLWLQRITTNEPDDSQCEIAIKALQVALEYDAV